MPNYCENDLGVEGPKEVIEEFLKFAAGGEPVRFQSVHPLSRGIPTPGRNRRGLGQGARGTA